MRQVIARVPAGQGKRALEIARNHEGRNLSRVSETGGESELVFIFLNNRAVGPLVDALEEIPEAQITLIPQAAIPMSPPADEVQQQVSNVTRRSSMEVWLNGLMSIGSWTGFLGYTLAGSLVVWTGMYTNTIYLLVAAMLIAPFAGPAMNTAIATATGDGHLLLRNLARYFASLGLTILITFLASWIYGQQFPTSMMITTSNVSALAVVLPLVAGAAGALQLINAQSNSLVSGAAVGLLVAASLAPPAGLVGMSAAIGRWDMAINGVFLLLLQLAGINLSGSLVFRFYGGLSPSGPRYTHGKSRYAWLSFGATVLALAGLLFWQFSSPPNLQRASREQRASEVVHRVVEDSGYARLVETDLRFTRSAVQGQSTLLGDVYVQPAEGTELPDARIEEELSRALQRAILEEGFEATPLFNVTVVNPP